MRAAASLVTCWLLLSGCKAGVEHEPVTQVLLRVDATGEVRTRATQARIRTAVQRSDDGIWAERAPLTIDITEPSQWPIDIPITPSDPNQLPNAFQVTAEALDSDGSVLSDARAITHFIRRSQRVLKLTLGSCGDLPVGSSCERDASCHGPSCRSCQSGSCEPIGSIDPRDLETLEGSGIETADAAAESSGDASAADGGGDPTTAGSGGPPATGSAGNVSSAGSPSSTGPDPAASGGGGASGDAGTSQPGPPVGATPPPLGWTAPELLESEAADVRQPIVVRNVAGDLALAWWQDAADGYIWMRRYRGAAWDTTPFRVNGPTRPSTEPVRPAVGIDAAGVAQIFFLAATPMSGGAAVRGYWVRWDGEPDVMLDAPAPSMGGGPMASALGNQTPSLPLALAVAEDASASALWLGAPDEETDSLPVFVNGRSSLGWGMPTHVVDMRSELFPPYWYAVDGNSGFYVSTMRTTPSDDESADALMAFSGGAEQPPENSKIELPEPLVGEVELAIEPLGSAVALFRLAGDPTRPRLFATRYHLQTAEWDEPQQLSDLSVEAADVVSSASLEPLAVWLETEVGSSGGQLALSRYASGSGWEEPTPVGDRFELAGADGLKIATNTSGELLVVWAGTIQLGGGMLEKAMFESHSNGWGAFSKPTVLRTYAGTIELLGVTWSDTGQAVIVWSEAASAGAAHDLLWMRSQ